LSLVVRSRDNLWLYSELTIHIGKVAANAHIDSAVNPAWRKAKTHVSIHLGIFESNLLTDFFLPADCHSKLGQCAVRSKRAGTAKEFYSNR
jgi:hypothetical protein